MSHIPPNGPPPPYGYAYGYPGGSHPPLGAYPGYAYVPAPVMMPSYPPQPPAPPQPEPVQPPQPTYVTNYIYQQPPQPEPVRVEDPPPPPPPEITVIHKRPPALFPGLRGQLAKTLSKVDSTLTNILTGSEIIDWASTTPHSALTLSHRAYVGGKEGWDDSPLWIIRAHHGGEFVPGKFVVKTRTAYIPYAGKEVPVHNFEVLLAQPHALRWVPSSHGHVPAGAFPAGNTQSGEPLYIARARHQRSTTPGKVHPSHGCCYISYGGSEIPYKQYEVLCKFVG